MSPFLSPGFLSFPDRLAALLAAETDERNVHALLTKEVHRLPPSLQTPQGGARGPRHLTGEHGHIDHYVREGSDGCPAC